MKLRSIQLHTPLFLGRTNLGDKLDTSKREGLAIEFRPAEQMVYVTFNAETGMIPSSGISCMIPDEPQAILTAPKPQLKSKQAITAQVSTPQGDLMTPGKGRTGQESR
jgi:hypothetical protein